MLLADILFLFLCLIMYAFFAGMETAFYAANRLRIELSHHQGSERASILSGYFHNPSSFIITCLAGNTIMATIITFRISHYLVPLLQKQFSIVGALAIDILAITGVLVITAEFLPKSVFKLYANEVMLFFARPFHVFYRMLRPLVVAIEAVGKHLLNIAFHQPLSTDDSRFSMEELEHIIKDHTPDEQYESEIDAELFENALEFRSLKVLDCMTPAADIVSFSADRSVSDLTNLILETNHSRIIVFRDNPDNIIGYVHHFDLHKQPDNINDILIPIRTIPETLGLDALLRHFIRTRKNIAIVENEEHTIVGMITMEDILEEIFGEIEDEYDNADLIEMVLSETRFRFSGRLEVDYVNKRYHLNIEEHEDGETLSDHIIQLSGGVPEMAQQVLSGNHLFTILEVSDTRIELVEVAITASIPS